MTEKTILITGATSGIGFETALALVKQGAQVVFTSRSAEKAEKTKQALIAQSGNQNVHWLECLLDDLQSVRSCAAAFRQKFTQLHVLINNAGIWETKRSESKDGIELTFAVNHLAPFLLTTLLMDIILKSAPARIINLASTAHKYGKMDFDDIEAKKSWGSMKSYAQSKLCNVLFTKELSRRLTGTGVTVNCVHPGVVNTHLFDKMPGWMMGPFSIFFITPAKGAETSIYLASSEQVSGISGEYFAKKKIARLSKQAKDPDKALKLWGISEKYTGNKTAF